ncbi:MAG: hypothetical protein WC028_31565 [Candidatus Obscuribacterales bacterium]|jgi:hypothetical protein
MLLTFLYTVAALAAVVGAIAAVRYPFTCRALERHSASPRPDFKTDEVASKSWNTTRWALDKARLRTGLTGICTYAVGMVALIPLQSILKSAESPSSVPMVIMLVLTAALLTVGITSVFHNGRLSDIDMKRRFPSMS